MTLNQFDAARVALARKYNQEPAFINSLLLIYLRHFVDTERLQDAIDAIDKLLSPKDAA